MNGKMNNPEILIIDDEAAMRKLLEITLQSNGYRVYCAENARSGLMMAVSRPPDLILLDLGLPDEPGQEVLQKLRGWYTHPVIILSVINSEEEIIRALDQGANDYLTKPFRTGELLARIRSALRTQYTGEAEPVMDCEDFLIDFSARIVRIREEVVRLTATEFALLTLLARNEGRVLTHPYLLRQVWGPGHVEQSQYLRVYIAQLRKKLEPDPNHPRHIITESGIGYRFVQSSF